MVTALVRSPGPASHRSQCVFCGRAGKLTNEHVIPWWLESGEKSRNAIYLRERGGPAYQPWSHARPGTPRDLQAKAPCANCNNGWMNDIDNELKILGRQLVKGKPVLLTQARQSALAIWSLKMVLMLQCVYPRDSRFVIPAVDYHRFYEQRQPDTTQALWAGYMQPPGSQGGPVLAFHEHRHDELFYDADTLARAGLDPGLSCKGYGAVFRFGYLVVGMVAVGSSDLLAQHGIGLPQHWVQIWPFHEPRTWPPSAHLKPVIGLPPFVG